jgi:hypothetical protein
MRDDALDSPPRAARRRHEPNALTAVALLPSQFVGHDIGSVRYGLTVPGTRGPRWDGDLEHRQLGRVIRVTFVRPSPPQGVREPVSQEGSAPRSTLGKSNQTRLPSTQRVPCHNPHRSHGPSILRAISAARRLGTSLVTIDGQEAWRCRDAGTPGCPDETPQAEGPRPLSL